MRYDLAALRVVAILAILLHHSFSAFEGWPPNVEHAVHTGLFFWPLSIFFKAVGLGLFTFISGALLNHSMEKPQKTLDFILKKSKRLLLPALFTGILYLVLFPDQIPGRPSLLNSIASTYLWYLPMLFLCQISTYFIRPSLDIKSILAFGGLYLVMNIFISHGWPFALTTKLCLPLFLAGYFHRYFINKVSCIAAAIIGGGIYIAYIQGITVTQRGFDFILIQACFAVSLYWPAHKLVRGPLPGLWSLIDRKSFHMYLSHQFVINTLLLTCWLN